jgi:hypothetical protein
MTPKQAVRRIERLRIEVKTEIGRAVKRTTKKGVAEFRRMSSGTETPKSLRQKDYPYARRHGTPILPPEIINKQRGVFFENTRDQPIRFDADGVHGQVINDSDVADFLNEGTDSMFRRPIADFVENYMENQAKIELETSLRKLEAKYG